LIEQPNATVSLSATGGQQHAIERSLQVTRFDFGLLQQLSIRPW
jgi:hypothetical protein